MRGLIYKELSVFFKSIDKKLIFIACAVIILLISTAGLYAGMLTSIMLAITIGMQNVMCLSMDEKTDWKKYQMALPVSGFHVVAGKYFSVLCTLLISLLGSILLNLLSSIFFRSFDFNIWKLSLLFAMIIPVFWTSICLPMTYWFGVQSSQVMGFFVFIPMFYIIKYFEDGPGFDKMAAFAHGYLPAACIGIVILFGVSMVLSVVGYERKK